jgi:hypothetical protein
MPQHVATEKITSDCDAARGNDSTTKFLGVLRGLQVLSTSDAVANIRNISPDVGERFPAVHSP